ncbi:MAG TPA: serine/threonine-protein kinase [Gemmataceae bacterium]|nr:serine/threonine-protein kinase [Gemmataceae bacterium]
MRGRSCPNPEQLAAFLAGRIAPPDWDEIAGHLESCAACQGQLETLDQRSASWLPAFSPLHSLAPPTADPELERLLRRAKAVFAIATAPLGLASTAMTAEAARIGDYELGRKLGQGSFGAVYLARDSYLGRQVAVKILHETHRTNVAVKTRFLQEMKAVGQLQSHPNVVQAFQASEENGVLYLVMEYVEGADLAQVLKQRGSLSIADACEVARQAALGLQHVHEHGLVHRDLKPANLVVTATGQVKILDLGLARLAEEPDAEERRTALGDILGTYDYMAPEQGQDASSVGIQADIYSLGCTLYRLATGTVPFPVAGKLAKLAAHRLETAAPLDRFRKDVPRGLQAIVDRMIAKKPADRYQAPREVADALEPFCSGAKLRVLPSEGDARTARREPATVALAPPGRRWRWLGMALAVVGLLASGVLLNLLLWRGPASEGDPGPIAQLRGHEGVPHTVAFAPNGRYAVSVDGTSVLSWDLERQGQLASWPHGGDLKSSNVAFINSRLMLVARNDREDGYQLRRYDARSGQPAETLGKYRAPVLAVALAPDGDKLVTTEGDNWVRIWDPRTARPLSEFRLDARASSAVFAQDGKQILCGCEDGVLRLCSVDGQHVQLLRGHAEGEAAGVVAVALAPDRGLAASASLLDQTVRLWELPAGIPRASLRMDEEAQMTCAALSGDCRRAWTGHQDGSVALWDLENRKLLVRYRQHPGRVTSVALAPDGRLALSASEADRLLWLYRLPVPAADQQARRLSEGLFLSTAWPVTN